jgi:hypothetical protein
MSNVLGEWVEPLRGIRALAHTRVSDADLTGKATPRERPLAPCNRDAQDTQSPRARRHQ